MLGQQRRKRKIRTSNRGLGRFVFGGFRTEKNFSEEGGEGTSGGEGGNLGFNWVLFFFLSLFLFYPL
jgi:hypothetical protein